MDGNMSAKGSVFTVKNVMRALALLCIIFVFCPSFLVSCSGQEFDISAMTAVTGVSMYGETIIEPYPIVLITLLLPAAMFAVLVIKSVGDGKAAGIVMACSVIDIIVWFVFRFFVKKIAEESYCEFKSTPWFFLNIIFLIALAVFGVMTLIGKLRLDMDLATAAGGSGTQNALNQMSATMSQMSSAVSKMAGDVAENIKSKTSKEDIIGYCSKCGTPIEYGSKFCTKCGTKVPDSLMEEAEAARKAAAEEAARKAAEEEAARKAAEEEAARKAAEEEAARKAAEEEAARKAAAEEAARKAAEEEAAMSSSIVSDLPQSETQQADAPAGTRPKFCHQCGAKLEEGARFCGACGTKIE